MTKLKSLTIIFNMWDSEHKKRDVKIRVHTSTESPKMWREFMKLMERYFDNGFVVNEIREAEENESLS